MNLLAILTIGVMSMLLHEAGHLFAAKMTSSRILRVGVNITGPYVEILVDPPCRWKVSINLLAGISVHFVLSGFLFAQIELLFMVGFVNLWFFAGSFVLPKSDGWNLASLFLK
jgi:hypothetical protein